MSQSLRPERLSVAQRNNWLAIKHLLLPCVFMLCFLTTLHSSWYLYCLGQLCGLVFLAQTFILLHEFGHYSFFESRRMNQIAGYLCSFFVLIPFSNWTYIHGLHHRWTGWRDKDPTTEKTFADRLSPTQERLVNFCWRWYLPLFTLGYRFGIYWKPEKLERHLKPRQYQRCLREMYIYGFIYLGFILVHPTTVFRALPALLLSFMITDILSLSQHSHIEMPVAAGQPVQPLRYSDQAQYTRSLTVPSWVAQYLLLNFNYHEAHHVEPGIPCYRLQSHSKAYPNSFPWRPWLRRVKSMTGVDFVFRSSSKRDGF